MDPTLRRLLEVSIQQQTVTQQLAHSLQAATQELVALRTATLTAATPLPDPSHEIRRLLPPLTPEEDLEAYFETFECITRREDWDHDEWPCILGPLLSGEARTAYYALTPEEAADYGEMKKGILRMVWADSPPSSGGVPSVGLSAGGQTIRAAEHPHPHNQEVASAGHTHRHRGGRKGGHGPVFKGSTTNGTPGRGGTCARDAPGAPSHPGARIGHPGTRPGRTANP
ncbi:terminal nucleotidyltransferase 4A-like [Ictalurus furcatus]|uniref:terminal nucleotidyltransferase 4A-like n=1 Tax=Ictalurus furcatus TaxID=66913 RepID=UPI00234FF8C5|nr:terminal nucleotidyltransferase 4A-like [Ictalurus furcatus]